MTSFVARFRWLAAAQSPVAAVAQTLLSRVAIIAINLGTGVIVARSLGPAGRGAAAAMSLWPIVLCGLTTFGIPTALRYHVRRNPENGERIFAAALILGTVAGFIALLGGIIVVPRILNRYPDSIINFSLIMMLFAPQIMLNNVLQAYLESRGDFAHSNTMQYVPPASTLVVLIVLHETQALSPYSVPLAYFVPTVFVTLWTAYRLRRSIRPPRHLIAQSRHLLNYGFRAYGLNVLTTLSGQIDQAIIIGFMSAASFGLYGIALNISAMLGVFASSLNIVLFPKAAELDADTAIAIVCRSARIIFATTTVAYILSLALLPFAIHIVYGAAYLPDIALTRILMIEVVLSSTSSTFAQAFMATGRPGLVTVLQGIGVCVTLPLMLLLIPHYGLLGAAYALVISTAIRLVLILLSFPTILSRPIPGLLPTLADIHVINARIRRAFGGLHAHTE